MAAMMACQACTFANEAHSVKCAICDTKLCLTDTANSIDLTDTETARFGIDLTDATESIDLTRSPTFAAPSHPSSPGNSTTQSFREQLNERRRLMSQRRPVLPPAPLLPPSVVGNMGGERRLFSAPPTWGDMSGPGDGLGGWGTTAAASAPSPTKDTKKKRKRGVSPPPAPPPMRAKSISEVSQPTTHSPPSPQLPPLQLHSGVFRPGR
jgi:hypothetical protein